ncbi:MAG: pitrilysin family protein [Cyanobacteria bacterium J06643_4]
MAPLPPASNASETALDSDTTSSPKASNDLTLGTGATVTPLSNGLTVIHQEMPTPTVVVDVWVRAGASVEPAEWSGMAHFLEHMVFKGTQRLQPGEFDWVIEGQGGVTNAATSHDYAHFYITVAAEALPQTLPYLADLLLGAAIPADEFVRERQVVLEEIRQAYDDPDWVGYQALCELLYGAHAYGRAVLGTPDVLNARLPEEMRRFHQAHYQPENMTVVIAGGIEKSAALALIEPTFNQFATPLWCPQAETVPLPMPTHQKQTLQLPNLEQGRLTMAWLGPGVAQLDVACGLDLLSLLLGGGRTSRLVRDLREERQIVQSVSSEFSLQQSCSVLSVSVYLEEERLALVEKIVCDRIQEFTDTLIPDAELARAKRLLLNDYAFSTETPGQIAGLYGYYATIADLSLAAAYPQQVSAMTAKSLQQIASQYVRADQYTAVVLQSM